VNEVTKKAERTAKGALFAMISMTVLAAPASAWATGSFMDCGPIENDDERLACYDRVYEQATGTGETSVQPEPAPQQPAADAAPAGPAPVTEDATDDVAIEQARAEAAFGFPRATYPDELEVLSSEVIRFSRNSRNQVLAYLENGQVWAQSDNKRVRTPEAPVTAEIAPGMLGAFFMTFEGKKQRIKVKRIR
jgi:hypothetical protein